MKNNRSMTGVAAAVLLALVGGLLLWQSSGDGSSEAVEAPVETVQVLVTARDINAGETASTLSENAFAFVRLEAIPADQALADALTSVDDLAELALSRNVVARPLTNGVQLSLSDFVVPGTQETSALPDVDENLFEVTVALEPQRALGGKVAVGQNVAVVGSFDPGDDSSEETVVILESVLVTNVQTEQLFTEQQLDADPLGASLAPTSRMFITFGVEVTDLEKLTYATEFGRIWLARQLDAATINGSEVQTRNSGVQSLDAAASTDSGGDDAGEG